MTNEFPGQLVRDLRTAYNTDPDAKAFFDWSASCERDASATSIDRIGAKTGLSYAAAYRLAKRLAHMGLGSVKAGRRGWASRFEWDYSRVGVGKTAAGISEDLSLPNNPVFEVDGGSVRDEDVPARSVASLTIPEAKRALSASLGVPIAAIEIIIRH